MSIPGEVFSPEDFWSMLHSGKDCVTKIPFSRFDIDEFYDPERGTIGKSYTNKAAFIKDIEWFDYEFFNISLAEANLMDPQHRILLEMSYESFSRAGYEKETLKGKNIGVYVAQGNHDWMTMSQIIQVHILLRIFSGNNIKSLIIYFWFIRSKHDS